MNHNFIVAKAETKTAQVYIFDDIGFWKITADGFASQFNSIPEGYKIDVCINSMGGDVYVGNTIANLISKRAKDVTCTVYGISASIASVIACAGGKTVGWVNSAFMIHNARALGEGDDEMETPIKLANDSMCAAFCKKTGKPEKDIRTMMDAETYLSPEDAKKHGFYDEIIDGDGVVGAMNFKQILAQANPNGGGIAANPQTMKGHKMTKLLNALAGAKLIASADLPEDAATVAFQASHATLVAQITNLQKENGDLKTAIESSKKAAVEAHVQSKVDAKIIGAELKPKWVSAILASPDAQGLLDAMQAPQASIPAPVPTGECETKVEAKTEKELRAQLETEQHPAKRFVIAKQLRELTTKK